MILLKILTLGELCEWRRMDFEHRKTPKRSADTANGHILRNDEEWLVIGIMLNSLGHGAENQFSLVVSSKARKGSCIFERFNVFVQ